jgi:hypothetical protein
MERTDMWLLIDDTRDLHCDCIARTPEVAKKLLAVGGFECVCFDHDLGSPVTGYDILCWAIEREFLPNKIQLVTSNPVGRQKMSAALKADGYSTINECEFYK